MLRPRRHQLLDLLLLVVLCAPAAGCNPFRGVRIDPSGERLFVRDPRPPLEQPGRVKIRHNSAVAITPTQVVAPVGAEVVMLAGVCDLQGRLSTGERVEWMLSPAGVGQIVSFDNPPWIERLMAPRYHSRKVDNTFAVSYTSKRDVNLNRGTPTPDDDVTAKCGQTWITVTSPVEGTSFVTAFAPDVFGWDTRQSTALIHWLDAQWTFPPPAANPVGSRHVFTTTIQRYSDRTPVGGWRVRYEILDGPEAAFAPGGGKLVEVTTDDLGQARAEIYQLDNLAGTNHVSVQIIRPADLGGAGGRRLLVANGTTQKTWTTAQLSLRMIGPSQATIGATATYQIELTGPGGAAVSGASVTADIPEGMSFVSSVPAVAPSGRRLQFALGSVPAGQTQTLEINLRADRPGTANFCAQAVTPSGLTAQDCTSTTVLAPALDVQVIAPEQVLVGEDVSFEVTVTNRGTTALSGLILVSGFDPGLAHASGANPIERDLEDLAPGEARRVGVTLRATQAGRLCNRVSARAVGGLESTAEACVNVFEAQGSAVPPAGAITVRKTGPQRLSVGQAAEFTIDITNAGTTAVNQLKIVDNYDRSLRLTAATDGFARAGADLIWQVDTLPPGKTIRFQVHCQCLTAQPRVCNRVTVTTAEGARADDEACLEVAGDGAAAPAGSSSLNLSISDRRDFVAAGKELTYEIVVTNNAATSDQAVVLSVSVPPEMTPLPVGTSGPARSSIEGQTVRFEPVAELRAGETLRFQVRVLARTAGEVRVQAAVRSALVPGPLVAEEQTSIFAGP